ncbi:hypothetical protein [Paenibacillus sp. NAIST15-1]|uniref:hypothetical protein n=1 Tax=Paenibacillus sp. NAIST15-1 TaxID=1605994 RepID=UPI0008689D20|nr:hypothetical protein [Paenibacillus sp. NAIST15-1]GAV11448.1 histidine kinase [Paenibacillus sp. NAIST15-1]
MYQVTVNLEQRVTIDKNQIAEILVREQSNLLGGSNRWIQQGEVWEKYSYHRDYEMKEKVRDASDEEVVAYDALNTVIDYFKKL